MIFDWYDISITPIRLEDNSDGKVYHDSQFKSHKILCNVVQMLERGDSNETVLEMIKILRQLPKVIYNGDGTVNVENP